jgi:peptidoglycan/xylan/chitin deacetylase (PgdA/CDA1 family)
MFDDRRTTAVDRRAMTVDPGASRGRLALTFDNLGEASELERGTWPNDRPLGEHPSATVALPRLLDELDVHGLTATFFLEAINCEIYPDAVREIAARGHEIGHHGWRHETWSGLDARDELETLERGRRAFAELGVAVRGFRPPGGELTSRSPQLLRDVEIDWCSPAAAPPGGVTGVGPVPFDWRELTYLPFDWSAVDAYQLTLRFEDLRRARGDPPQARAPIEVLRLFSARVDGVSGDAVPGVLVMHPFLMVEPEWWECVQELLRKIGALVREGALWAGSGGRCAACLREPDAE